MKSQAKLAFEARGLAVREKPYRINPADDGDDINFAGRDACDVGPNGVVFYAGRGSQLLAFLKGMQNKCAEKYPNFLGGDSVSRFVLDGGLNSFPKLTVDYLSQASSLAWKSDCSGTPNSIGFFVVYRKIFSEGVCSNTRSGGSLLAHDALLVLIQGVRNTGLDQPSPESVLGGIEDITSEGCGPLSKGRGPLLGASGMIDYPCIGTNAIPKDKAILVLRGGASVEPERRLLCGQLGTAQPPSDMDKCSGR